MRLSLAARQLLNSLAITTPACGLSSTTVYVDRPLRRNLAVWRELESAGLITITFERDVTTPNMRFKKSFITYKLEKNV